MTTRLIGRNTRVEVQKTLGTAIPITGITNASEAVVTFTGVTAPVNGDYIIFDDDLDGTTELAGQIARVSGVSASPQTFHVENIDSTNFGVFSGASSFSIITAWSTLGVAQSVTVGSANPNRLDATTLLDSEKQYVFGQSESPEITVAMLSDPFLEAVTLIETAARSNNGIGFRMTMSDGSKRLLRGFFTLPTESVPLGALVTSDFSITQIRRRLAFAS